MGSFDMMALMNCKLLNVIEAVNSYPSREDFWVALSYLTINGSHFLSGYTPSVVICDMDTRNSFLKDLGDTYELLSALKVEKIPALLETLYGAVARNDEKSLSDGLRVFAAEIDILLRALSDALIPDREAVKKPEDLPVVMAVDDMPEILSIISEILLDDYRVIALTGGHAAMKALQRHTPSLFLLDIEMPDMNGYELAKHIRAIDKYKTTPILFLSGKGTREHVLAAKLHGGNDFMLKPVDKDKLLKTIKQHLK